MGRLINTTHIQHAGRHILHVVWIASVLLATTGTAVSADVDRVRELRSTQSILPLSEILEDIEKTYPGKVIDVELEEEHDQIIYEIELIGDDRKVIQLNIDAKNGRLIREGDD